MLWAVCGPSLRNRGILDNDTLGSQWGYQLEAEIIILNELKEPDARERRALEEKKHAEEVQFLKRTNAQLKKELETYLAPSKK
jgi:hypothetical protein